MKLKLYADLNGHKKGDIIEVKEKNGYPVDIYWKRRLRDAKTDGCVEIYKEAKSYKKKGDE